MIHYPFDVIVATNDWHPSDHGSFASNHADKKVGDHMQLGGLDQIRWPAIAFREPGVPSLPRMGYHSD